MWARDLWLEKRQPKRLKYEGYTKADEASSGNIRILDLNSWPPRAEVK